LNFLIPPVLMSETFVSSVSLWFIDIRPAALVDILPELGPRLPLTRQGRDYCRARACSWRHAHHQRDGAAFRAVPSFAGSVTRLPSPALPFGRASGKVPQREQVWMECAALTASHNTPALSLLYLSMVRNDVQAASDTDPALLVLPGNAGVFMMHSFFAMR
jgi:hypothetical protein